jgi:hypothetical protein
MGMYTELIFGASLKKDTPSHVIDALQYMMGDIDIKPNDFPLPTGRCEYLFQGCSYYFGVSDPVSYMWKDDGTERWIVSTRSSIKDYEGEIDTFLNWIKSYIDSGSGLNDMYAIVTHEEAIESEVYYLNDIKEEY